MSLPDVVEWFLGHVPNRNDPSACWTIGGDFRNYYPLAGYFTIVHQGRTYNLHRAVLAVHQGIDIPPRDVFARHLCSNKVCVNPRHLTWGSLSDNMADYAQEIRELRDLEAWVLSGY